jgi:hypothetical protein
MKNKNFVPKKLIERVLYEDSLSSDGARRILEGVFEKKTFLKFKYRDVSKIINGGLFALPSHNIKRYVSLELSDNSTINGVQIPSGRASLYVLSMYLAEVLGIEKIPTGNESFNTIKNGLYVLLLEFDITSLLKYQELMIKLTAGVLTGKGPLVAKKEMTVSRSIKGGYINE